jgi:hypothetical protein
VSLTIEEFILARVEDYDDHDCAELKQHVRSIVARYNNGGIETMKVCGLCGAVCVAWSVDVHTNWHFPKE